MTDIPYTETSISLYAQKKLADMAAELGLTYIELMNGARDWLNGGHLLTGGYEFMNVETPEGFWPLYELATGTHPPEKKRVDFFSCSC